MTPSNQPADDEFGLQLRRALAALPDVPPALQRAALALWPARAAQPLWQQAGQALLRRIEAVLTFDSCAGPALVQGMWSMRAPTRHLLFAAQGRDIDLRIASVGDFFTLTGQVLSPDEAGSVVLDLPGAAQAARSATLDGMGEFRLDGLGSGIYTLTLHLGGDALVLPPIGLGPIAAGATPDGQGG